MSQLAHLAVDRSGGHPQLAHLAVGASRNLESLQGRQLLGGPKKLRLWGLRLTQHLLVCGLGEGFPPCLGFSVDDIWIMIVPSLSCFVD